MFLFHIAEVHPKTLAHEAVHGAEVIGTQGLFAISGVFDRMIGWNTAPAHPEVVTSTPEALSDGLPDDRREAFQAFLHDAHLIED